MRKISFAAVLMASAALIVPATANDGLLKLIQDPNQWAIQTGDYANTRYSKLDQINASNAGKIAPAWTFMPVG